MPYITHADLAESPGALELSEVASDEHRPMVPAELLDAVLRGADVSTWLDEDVQAAQRALERIDAAVRDACSLIDGYLAKRGYALPLSPVHPLVSAWARGIARYLLHKNRTALESKDPIARGYNDAVRLLQQTADGKFSLGAQDAVANDQTDARFMHAPKVFGRDQLRGFR